MRFVILSFFFYLQYKMGEYKWKSFVEIEKLATSFSRGMKELGLTAKKNVVIFAETRAEWMIAAHACFKQNLTIVTIYSTLGDDAIAHGINETEVDTVITSFELLPKFKRILQKVPEVKNIVFIEDQLQEADVTGFKVRRLKFVRSYFFLEYPYTVRAILILIDVLQEGVRILPFQEVVKVGSTSTATLTPPSSEDTAIIMYTSGSTGVPKGVILSHKNVIATLKGYCDAVVIKHDDVFLGYLPLAHVFELLSESVCLLNGVPIGYSSSLTMIDSSSKIQKGCKGDASVLHPTCLTAVPVSISDICCCCVFFFSF